MPYPPSPSMPNRLSSDLVHGDLDALATHMRHCARAQGRWFSMRSSLCDFRAIAAGRIVTTACLALVISAGLLSVA